MTRFAVLECYATYVGSCLPTFRDSLLDSTSRDKLLEEELRHGASDLPSCNVDAEGTDSLYNGSTDIGGTV